jgi:hypothetical protein
MMADHIEYLGELKRQVADESGKILYLMISGSHLFGFESEDSDTDYRGCYQVVTNKITLRYIYISSIFILPYGKRTESKDLQMQTM